MLQTPFSSLSPQTLTARFLAEKYHGEELEKEVEARCMP